MSIALVLAGGGVAGIAWELGVLSGIADADPELAERLLAADVVIGTSAGSAVAAQVTSGALLSELHAAQLAPGSAEIDPGIDLATLVEDLGRRLAGISDPAEVKRALGRIALESETVSEADRMAAIRSRLPRAEWPERDLRIVTVDAGTGDRVVLGPRDGVPLELAVAASCAIPGIWPATTIGERRYVDGGVHSVTNADLAAGSDRVVVLVPSAADEPPLLGLPLAEELPALGGADVLPVHADAEAVAAFGADPLSVASRGPAAEHGRRQGRLVAADVAALLAG